MFSCFKQAVLHDLCKAACQYPNKLTFGYTSYRVESRIASSLQGFIHFAEVLIFPQLSTNYDVSLH